MNNVALKRITQDDLWKSKSQELVENGYVSLTEDDLPFSSQDWETIIKTYNELDFHWVQAAETGEELKNYECFRIKKAYLPEIYNSTLWELFNSQFMCELYNSLLPLKTPWFERFQAHRIHPGGFHSKHPDDCTYKEYLYTMLIHPEDDYEGGEFNIYIDENNPIVIRPLPRSILIFKSSIVHSVDVVTAGIRKSIIGVFTEGKCYPRIVEDGY